MKLKELKTYVLPTPCNQTSISTANALDFFNFLDSFNCRKKKK